MKKALFVIAIVALAASLIFWRTRPEGIAVRIGAAEYGPVEKTVSNTRAGTIKACRRSKLSTPAAGVVDRLLVTEGDRVEAGQLLLELWNRDQQANVEQAQASLQAARHVSEQSCLLAERGRREADRATAMLAKGLLAEDDADRLRSNAEAQASGCASAKSQVGLAKAALAMQRAMLERFRLHAPFAGVIAEINSEIGEHVTPSPPGVLTPPAIDIIDTSCLYATAPIDEVDAAGLHLGMPVRITLDAFAGRSFNGKLDRIAPYVKELEKQARTVDVDIRFDKVPDDVILLIGYSADITIILDHRENVLRIPTEALTASNEIWVLEQDAGGKTATLHKRQITPGIGNYTHTEVTAGLKQGELVVRSPDQAGIAEGVPATLKPDQE